MNKAIKATIGGKVDNKNINLLDKFFEIPAYQRLYEWESTQIEELLNDIKKAWEPYILQDSKSSEDLQKSIKPYFIGNITTSAKNNKGEHDKTNDKQNKIYVLIDGQQRLTTLWFIGFYLASKDCGEWQQKWKEFILQNNKLRIAMPIRDKEREALESLAKKIQKHNKEEKLELSNDLQGIHQKIIDAFKCIESWFVSENAKDIDLAKFAEYILKKVCFVFVKLAQNTDLNRFFVRMNNRGKQLEKHEILKARILSVIQQGGGEWQKYAKIWDLCSDMNKYIFQSASDRNIFEKENKNDDTPDKVESIIDFPTFLLHCYKLFIVDKLLLNEKGKYAENEILEILKKITITQDKLLEIVWDNQTNNGKNKEVILDSNFILNIKNDTNRQAKENCKEFIESMLRYRVLFDYFVIKDDVRARSSNNYKIMRLNESKDNYSLPENSKKGELTSGVFHDLVMIQNYLRVARQGDRQNYHHWLTPFLQFLDNQICLEMDLSLMKNCEFDFTNFKCGAKKIAEQFSKDECDDRQKVLVRFLENLDTNLAIAQLSNKELLDESNKAIKEAQNYQLTETPANIDFNSLLNNGTGTPHYWFYRLEYYLWKWGKYNQTKLEEIENKFGAKIYNTKLGESKDEIKLKDIFTKNLFHFRMLGSIEHFSAIQRERKQEKWGNLDKLDIFGNLALISQNFNSSLSNQLEQFKKDEVIKQLKRGRLESLKYFIMCANLNGDEWTENDAQAHQKQMIGILIKSLKSSQEK